MARDRARPRLTQKPVPPPIEGAAELGYIHPSLREFAVPLDTLTLDPTNARAHDERNLTAIEQSLGHHGQLQVIVVQRKPDGALVVRAGNGRVVAARRLGWTHMAALITDQSDIESLTFALRDNRTSELAAWGYEELAASLRVLQLADVDLATLGWKDFEYEPLLAATFTPAEAHAMEAVSDKPAGASLYLTSDQRITVNQAIARLKAAEADADMKEGRAIELICADYLAGHHPVDTAEDLGPADAPTDDVGGE